MSDTKRTITPNDPADFTPTREPQIPLRPFRYWCQKVLPLVYDDSLSYYDLLCKVVDYLNKTMEDVSNMDTDVTNVYTAYSELQSYVNSYFDSLDVQQEINNKLDSMASDGTLANIINNEVFVNINTSIFNKFNSNRYIITVGDSYGDKDYLGINYVWPMAFNRFRHYNISVAGAGFGSVASSSFSHNLTNNLSNIVDKELVTDIVVCGGYNDRNDTTQNIENGISSFIDICKTNFPKATVYIGFIGWCYDFDNYSGLVNAFKVYSRCSYFGAVYLSGVENAHHLYSGYKDTTHPNNSGSDRIGRAVLNATLNGSCSIGEYTSFSVNTLIGDQSSVTIFQNQLNSNIYMTTTSIFLNNTNIQNYVFDGSNYIDILNLGLNGFVRGNNQNYAKTIVPVIVNNNIFAQGIVTINEGTIKIVNPMA